MRFKMLAACAPLAFAILSAVPHVGNAQSGLFEDQRTRYAVITGPGQDNQHGPVLGIVLWRGSPGWEQVAPGEHARIDSIYRWTQLRASEAHLSFFGSGLAYGLLADDLHEIIVEGQHFPLHASDSALVIMVEVPPNGLPRTVATARIPAGAVPDEFWPHSWSSGDTTFIVHPRYPRDAAMLHQALLVSRAVADYLR